MLWPGGLPPGSGVQLWRLSDKKSFTFKNLEAAGQFGKGAIDMYVSAGLAPHANMPSKSRLNNESVVGIPGLWADIDINGGPNAKTGAAPSVEEALELANVVLEPTIIVNSGYGIQGWWLLEDAWVFNEKQERDQATRLLVAWQSKLRAMAKEMGWTIDPTHELARVMRLPGTMNGKATHMGGDAVPVDMMEDDGPRYELDSIQEVCQEYIKETIQSAARVTGDGIDIVLNTQPSIPSLKIDELKSIDPEFEQVWEHRGTNRARKKWSMSSYEMSIANYLVRAGFTDQEIADCLVYHRLRHEPGDPKGKASRPDYIAATIGKARAGVDQEERELEEEEERDEAVQQLSAMSRADTPDPVRATSLFTTVVGGPEVKWLIQDGRDPETAQFRLELADGRDVPIGPPTNLINQERFRERFMVVTSVLPRRCKADKWDEVVRALLKTAQVNETDSRKHQVFGWLETYLDFSLSTDRDAACQAMDPYEHEDWIFIHVGTLTQWLRKSRGSRLKDTEVQQYLIAAGFERERVTYTKDTGTRTQRIYWKIPKGELNWL